MIHPDDRAQAVALRTAGFSTGRRDVYRVVHPDGRVRHLQAWTDVQRDDARARWSRSSARPSTSPSARSCSTTVAIEPGQARSRSRAHPTATWECDLADRRHLVGPDVRADGPRPPAQPTLDDFLAVLHPDDRATQRWPTGPAAIATGSRRRRTTGSCTRTGSLRHVRAWTDVRRAPDGASPTCGAPRWTSPSRPSQPARLARERGALPGRLRQRADRHVDDQPGAEDQGQLPAGQRGVRGDARPQPARSCAGLPLGEPDPPGRPRARRRAVRPAGPRRDADARLREALPARGTAHVVHAWITSTVVHGADGEPLYLVTHALDISERLREQAELERLALTDTLTGLANRTLLNDRLDQALARLHRTGGACAMLLLDVDRFKTVNDSLGHQVGDALLVEVAQPGRGRQPRRLDGRPARRRRVRRPGRGPSGGRRRARGRRPAARDAAPPVRPRRPPPRRWSRR